MDLLLHLVRRDEIDICDIPIVQIADQYMDFISSAGDGRLELAGEFFVMAATLMRIKSRMLLPAPERSEEASADEEDPRWELTRMLLEYRRFKDAAAELSARIVAAMDLIPRRIASEPLPEPENAVLENADRFELWSALNRVLRRLEERTREGRVEAEKISVSDCMDSVRALLAERGSFLFTELFPADGAISRLLLAASFLAVLELARLGVMTLSQSADFDDILCRATPLPETPSVGAP